MVLLSVLGALFIPQPWLALIPTVLFAGLYHSSHRKLAGTAALIWLLYCLYEYAMYRRWLCTGECNIRLDLLLIYPLIVLVSIPAAVVAISTIVRRPAKANAGRGPS